MNDQTGNPEEQNIEGLNGDDELELRDPRDQNEDDPSEPNVYVIGDNLTQSSVAVDLDAARQLAAEYLDIAQRTRAELINYRKRVEAERQEQQRYSIEQVVIDLLPVLDSLAQAEQLYKNVVEGENPLVDGVRKTIKLFAKALTKHGAELISEAGVPFDGNLHMALMTDESADVQEPTVSEVYQQGIRIGDRVVKPAMVKVLTPASCGNGTGGCACCDTSGGGDGGG